MTLRKEAGEEYDVAVEAAWDSTFLKQRIETISTRGHRLSSRIHSRSSWKLTAAAEPEQPSEYEDRRVVQYLLEFLERDSVERRFGELLGNEIIEEKQKPKFIF